MARVMVSYHGGVVDTLHTVGPVYRFTLIACCHCGMGCLGIAHDPEAACPSVAKPSCSGTELQGNGNCLMQDLFPGAFLFLHPVNRCLCLMVGTGVVYPHDLESSSPLSILDPDQVSRSQFVIDSRQECSTAAYVSRNCVLHELLVLGSKTP